MKTISVIIFISALLTGCGIQSDKEKEADKKFSLEKIWSTDTLLKTPESAFYYEKLDIIFVANMDRGADGKDREGFISKVSRKGEIVELKWVTGLKAPKGMGVKDGRLYVTEIDKLAIIDITEAKILEKVKVEGAKFLNDVSIDASGIVYFSDSHDNKIYTYSDGKVELWLNEGIHQSNGLFCEKNRILVAAGDFLAIDYETKKVTVINDSISGGDGIAYVGDGYYLVSEWPGEVFLIAPDNSIVSLLNTREPMVNTADIDYIQKDSLLLVPTFFSNRIDAYKLTAK